MSKNFSAKYYQKKTKRLKIARQRYQNLLKEEKEKNRQYGRERYKNLPENEKQKLVEHRKKYYKIENTFFL